MRRGAEIPGYLLYGEADEDAELRFLHVETIAARASLHDWTIRPHRHRDLHQFMAVTSGGGVMHVEDRRQGFRARALISMPPLAVHGFDFTPHTEGFVLTVAAEALAALVAGVDDAAIPATLAEPRLVAVARDDPLGDELEGYFAAVAREFLWPQLGRGEAIGAWLRLIVVALARRTRGRPPAGEGQSGARRGDREAFDRLRGLVEAEYRHHPRVGRLAEALGMSEERLNALCRRTARRSALELVHARLMLEAKRCLLYTSMSVGEIAYGLGFEDPAYFSRFFARRAGLPPVEWRKSAADERSLGGAGAPGTEGDDAALGRDASARRKTSAAEPG
jgi:AraC family transcriptional activator of pobA